MRLSFQAFCRASEGFRLASITLHPVQGRQTTCKGAPAAMGLGGSQDGIAAVVCGDISELLHSKVPGALRARPDKTSVSDWTNPFRD